MKDLIGTFVVTQLAIVLVFTVVYYFLRRQPNLATRRRALDDITHVPLFVKEMLAELHRGLREMRTLKDKKVKLHGRSEASRGLGLGWAQRLILQVFLIVVWLGLFEAEAAIGMILNVAANLLGMGREYAAVAGPLMALGAFLVTHAVILAVHKADRARRTWRWLRSGTVVSLICVTVAWVVFMGGRTIDPSDLAAAVEMEHTLTHALYVLALVNATAAAFCGGIVLLLVEDAFLEHEIARTEQLIRDHAQHILDVAREALEHKVKLPDDIEEQLDEVHEVITPTRNRRPPSNLVTVATAVLLVLFAAGAQAQDTNPRRPVAAAADTTQLLVLDAGTCELIVDVSASADPAARQEAVLLFAAGVDRYITMKGCRRFRVSAFADDPYARLAEVEIPAVEEVTDACAAVPVPSQRPVEIWFPTLTQARQQLAANDCASQLQVKQAAAAGRRRRAIAEVAHQVQLVAQNIKPRGRCTALGLSIALAHARSQEVVVVSDGFETCPVNPDAVVVENRAGYTWLNIVLIPSAGSENRRWAELTGRLIKLQGQYPGARICPYNELALGWSR